MATILTHFDQATQILTTEFKGDVSVEDAHTWSQQLWAQLNNLDPNSQFKLLLDIRGLNPVSLEAHKAMRTIIPDILAQHGMRPAFIDLFDEKPEIAVTVTRGIRCIAFANVHHDKNKMADYQKRIGRSDQQFFTDIEMARRWLAYISLQL